MVLCDKDCFVYILITSILWYYPLHNIIDVPGVYNSSMCGSAQDEWKALECDDVTPDQMMLHQHDHMSCMLRKVPWGIQYITMIGAEELQYKNVSQVYALFRHAQSTFTQHYVLLTLIWLQILIHS